MNADITVLVQTYNRPDKIRTFLESLQNEDLTGIEVIIVDNGSSIKLDNLENEVKKLPAAKLIRREKNCLCVDCGQSLIALATSPYVLNPGDDDIIILGSLQKLRDQVLKNPDIDALVTNMEVVNQNGIVTGHNFPPSMKEMGAPELLFARLLRENVIAWPSTLFRPEKFRKLSDWNFTYRTSLDWAFWLLNSPTLKVATTDLKVVKYVRHESNESSVVNNDQQFYESISMRIRTLTNPDLRSYLNSLDVAQVETLMGEIVKDSYLVKYPEVNRTLITLLIQSFSILNQRLWEPFLMGLGMVPWDAKAFGITHHISGDVVKYWQGYPYNLRFNAKSCLKNYEESFINSSEYIELQKARALTFSCLCVSEQVADTIIINCNEITSLSHEGFTFHLLRKASEVYRDVEGTSLRGIERRIIIAYRRLKHVLPQGVQTLIKKFPS